MMLSEGGCWESASSFFSYALTIIQNVFGVKVFSQTLYERLAFSLVLVWMVQRVWMKVIHGVRVKVNARWVWDFRPKGQLSVYTERPTLAEIAVMLTC